MNTDVELKPCAHCGDEARLIRDERIFSGQHYDAYPGQKHGFLVECAGACHSMTCWWHTEEQAIAAWNRRSSIPAGVSEANVRRFIKNIPSIIEDHVCGGTDARPVVDVDGLVGALTENAAALSTQAAVPEVESLRVARAVISDMVSFIHTGNGTGYYVGENVIPTIMGHPSTLSPTPEQAEPVAWRYRFRTAYDGEFVNWCISGERPADDYTGRTFPGFEEQPLYTHSPAFTEGLEAAAKAGWDACRKSLYAVCEDVQQQADSTRIKATVGSASQEHHAKGYHAGQCHAAKSIARGFNAMEARDDDNFAAAIRSLSEKGGA